MAIPCYLALTAAEFSSADPLPEKIAWMACHFSCYSTGLSNLPPPLPEGSVIIVNDRTPLHYHDPQRSLDQLTELMEVQKPDSFLLDFQRPDVPLAAEIAALLSDKLPCPVAVTSQYGKALGCPVFLEPPPLHMPLAEYVTPWQGRQIWLEAVPEAGLYRITAEGCNIESQPTGPLDEPHFTDDTLYTAYHISTQDNWVDFTLQRGFSEWEQIMSAGGSLGISRLIGLYQLFHKK